MKIDSIILKNFRQFQNVEVDLHFPENRNIILIHGKNGTGKTNFIEAVKWCLYGQKKTRIEKNSIPKTPIANVEFLKRLKDGEITEYSVQLTVSENESEFCIERIGKTKKTGNSFKTVRGRINFTQNKNNKISDLKPQEIRDFLASIAPTSLINHYLNQEIGPILNEKELRLLFKSLKLSPSKLLNKKLNLIFSSFVERLLKIPVSIEINEKYHLSILNTKNGKSAIGYFGSSEVKICNLITIISLLKLAKKEIPIILDEPYGRIDKQRGEQLAKNLSQFSDQILLIGAYLDPYIEKKIDDKIAMIFDIKEDAKSHNSKIILRKTFK